MKKNEKQAILILIIISILIITVIYFWPQRDKENSKLENENVEEFVQNLEDGTKLNISTKLSESKKLGNLEIGNIQLTYRNGFSVVLADVVNTSSSVTSMMVIELTLLDEKGNTLESVEGIIGPLQPGESTQLNIGTTTDYANAYDFTIEKK